MDELYLGALIPDMLNYIQKYNLPITEIFLTENDYVPKSYILKSLNAEIHYDDNNKIKNDVESVGTKFILI